MNSVTVLAHTVNPTNGVINPRERNLRFIAGTSLPFIWGACDAQSGMICVPEAVFVTKADQREYTRGWAAIKGHNATTRQILGMGA